MTANQNPHYKMRIVTGPQPSEEEMDELFGEAAALQMAIDECDDDSLELEELQAAYRAVIRRVRLNLYRLGKDPTENGALSL